MKWDDIAKRLPGRSSISCRLRYQNYLEKRAIWDEEKKNKLARLYARYVQMTPFFWRGGNKTTAILFWLDAWRWQSPLFGLYHEPTMALRTQVRHNLGRINADF